MCELSKLEVFEMDGLIQVRKEIIGGGEVNAVDARELYVFLKSKQEFANWISNYSAEPEKRSGYRPSPV